jgi:hypothetical protein
MLKRGNAGGIELHDGAMTEAGSRNAQCEATKPREYLHRSPHVFLRRRWFVGVRTYNPKKVYFLI